MRICVVTTVVNLKSIGSCQMLCGVMLFDIFSV